MLDKKEIKKELNARLENMKVRDQLAKKVIKAIDEVLASDSPRFDEVNKWFFNKVKKKVNLNKYYLNWRDDGYLKSIEIRSQINNDTVALFYLNNKSWQEIKESIANQLLSAKPNKEEQEVIKFELEHLDEIIQKWEQIKDEINDLCQGYGKINRYGGATFSYPLKKKIEDDLETISKEL